MVWRPGHGGFAFTVVCKATFELRPDVSPLAAAQEPVVEADVSTGEGGGLALASELVPFKKRPEVLVTGHAHAPEGRPARSLVARLVAGEIDKAIQVVGDRSFDAEGRLGDPIPFGRMPLVWERAAGGPGTSNPAGMSLGDGARTDFLGRVPAPNLLPVGFTLTSRSDIVPPVGFGPIAPSWPTRAACLQRHAAVWDPGRWHECPLPAEIDLMYFNAAPHDQQRAQPFGEESIYLEHLHPRFPRLSTRLAPVTPAATVDRGVGPEPLQLRCDTMVIDTDRGLAMLVWRAHVVLDHPDRPGLVVVTGPAEAEEEVPAWARGLSDVDATLGVSTYQPSSPVLPFSDAAAPAAELSASAAVSGVAGAGPAAVAREHAGPPLLDETAAPALEQAVEATLVPGFIAPAAALPFGSSQGESAPRREAPAAGSGSGLPFMPPPASEEHDGPPTARRGEAPEVRTSPMASTPWAASWISAPAEAQPWGEPVSPWAVSPDAARAFAPQVALRAEPIPPHGPLPSASAEPASPRLPSASASGGEPVPPPLLGAIAAVPLSSSATRETEQRPVAEAVASGEASAVEPEPEVAFDAYPPDRCGAIAARLACEEDRAGEILCAEDLDAARWKRVHEHWLDRIRDEAAHGRKKSLSEYDAAYVSALEAKRGPIALEEYARLAEAAERGAVAGALAERGLPEGAWPHVHRVWIGRMVKDVRLGKQVRRGIDAVRAKHRANPYESRVPR